MLLKKCSLYRHLFSSCAGESEQEETAFTKPVNRVHLRSLKSCHLLMKDASREWAAVELRGRVHTRLS